MFRRSWLSALAGVLLAASALPAQPATQPIATVNGTVITLAEIEALIKAAGPLPAPVNQTERRQQLMEKLSIQIDNLLIRQYLERHISPVTPAQVDKYLKEMERGLTEQGKSMAEFCNDTKQTIDQLRASVANDLRWAAYLATRVNDDVLKEYYKFNKDHFDEVTVRASHIVLRVPSYGPTRDKEKAGAYAKLVEIRNKLLNDSRLDFAEMARKHSQDHVAKQGGDLGFFGRKWFFDESFCQAAFGLKVGEISDIIETSIGLHLIKVTDRKPGNATEFERIRERVRCLFVEDLRVQILEQERKNAIAKGQLRITLP